ncbi:RiPP maturation radical SAM C-methyltransferase, partial [Streptomyces sp. NPDC004561]
MRVHLVTMPWQPLDLPSLQLGLLQRIVRGARPADEVAEFHGSLRWAEYLLEHSGGRLRPGDYVAVGSDAIFHGLGDWVFSGVLYDDPGWGLTRLRDYAAARDLCVDTAVAMRPYAAGFVEECATGILAAEPDVVGFTTTFMQNVTSLAL